MNKENLSKNKPSWDEYFLEITKTVALRATCDRGKSGCVIVKDNRILSTGYVGAPAGLPSCDEVGHLIRKVTYEDGCTKEHCQRTIHAEANAILYAAKYGVAINGATLYCSMVPCQNCAMTIIACGIKKVVALNNYQAGSISIELFKNSNIELVIINNLTITY